MDGCCESDSCSEGAVEGGELLDQCSMLLLLTAEWTNIMHVFCSFWTVSISV